MSRFAAGGGRRRTVTPVRSEVNWPPIQVPGRGPRARQPASRRRRLLASRLPWPQRARPRRKDQLEMRGEAARPGRPGSSRYRPPARASAGRLADEDSTLAGGRVQAHRGRGQLPGPCHVSAAVVAKSVWFSSVPSVQVSPGTLISPSHSGLVYGPRQSSTTLPCRIVDVLDGRGSCRLRLPHARCRPRR